MPHAATLEDYHKFGILHDAVAVVLFNKDKKILLILRSKDKSDGGKWEIPATHYNEAAGYYGVGSCCIENEVGIKNVQFDYLGHFHYCATVGDVIENEIVHVVIARYDGALTPNPKHCADVKWVTLDEAFNNRNLSYCYWLHEGMVAMADKIREHIERSLK